MTNEKRQPLTRRIRAFAVAVVVAATPYTVFAQAAPSTSDKAAPAPNSAFAKQPGNLSDKLNASNGVIRPKEVDPKIEKPAPSTGTSNVIPPPGSPGGAPGVQPK